MSKLNRDKFSLKNVTVKDDLVIAEFEETFQEGDTSTIINHVVKHPSVPHPDLIEWRDKLRLYLAKANSITLGFDHVLNEFKLNAGQVAELKSLQASTIALIQVGKIERSGSGATEGIQTKGFIKSWGKASTKIESLKVNFLGTKLGFELELKDIFERIENEVYLYIYDGKKAQLELFDTNDDVNATNSSQEIKEINVNFEEVNADDVLKFEELNQTPGDEKLKKDPKDIKLEKTA